MNWENKRHENQDRENLEENNVSREFHPEEAGADGYAPEGFSSGSDEYNHFSENSGVESDSKEFNFESLTKKLKLRPRRTLMAKFATSAVLAATVAALTVASVVSSVIIDVRHASVTDSAIFLETSIINPGGGMLIAVLRSDDENETREYWLEGEEISGVFFDNLKPDTYYEISIYDETRHEKFFSQRYKTEPVQGAQSLLTCSFNNRTVTDEAISFDLVLEGEEEALNNMDVWASFFGEHDILLDRVPVTSPETHLEFKKEPKMNRFIIIVYDRGNQIGSFETVSQSHTTEGMHMTVNDPVASYCDVTVDVFIENIEGNLVAYLKRNEAASADVDYSDSISGSNSSGRIGETPLYNGSNRLNFTGLTGLTDYTFVIEQDGESIYERGVSTSDYPIAVATITATGPEIDALAARIYVENVSPYAVEVALYGPNGEMNRGTLTDGENTQRYEQLSPATEYRISVEYCGRTLDERAVSTLDYDDPVVTLEETAKSYNSLAVKATLDSTSPDPVEEVLYGPDGEMFRKVLESSESSFSQTNLLPLTTYSVKLEYRGRVLKEISITTDDYPEPVVNVTTGQVGTESFTMNFDVEKISPDALEAALYSPDGTIERHTIGSGANEITFSGLTPVTTYTVRVEYRGGTLSEKTVTTADYSDPTVDIRLTDSGPTSLNIAVTLDSVSPDDVYAVLSGPTGEIGRRLLANGQNNLEFNENLVPLTDYSLKTIYRDKTLMEVSYATTDYPTPTARISFTGSETDSLSFSVTVSTSSPDTVYAVLYSADGSVGRRALTNGNNSISFTGLRAKTQYTLKVEYRDTVIAETTASTPDYPDPTVTLSSLNTDRCDQLDASFSVSNPQNDTLDVKMTSPTGVTVFSGVLGPNGVSASQLEADSAYTCQITCRRTGNVVYSDRFRTSPYATFEKSTDGRTTITRCVLNPVLQEKLVPTDVGPGNYSVTLTNQYDEMYDMYDGELYGDLLRDEYDVEIILNVNYAAITEPADDEVYYFKATVGNVEKPVIDVVFTETADGINIKCTLISGDPNQFGFFSDLGLTYGPEVEDTNYVGFDGPDFYSSTVYEETVDISEWLEEGAFYSLRLVIGGYGDYQRYYTFGIYEYLL